MLKENNKIELKRSKDETLSFSQLKKNEWKKMYVKNKKKLIF